MRKLLFLLALTFVLSGHDMFLKMDTYLLDANSTASIQLFNGTFEISENFITRDRMIDVSLVGNGDRISVDTSQWENYGDTTVLSFKTGDAGTWIAGVSTAARNIELDARAFNDYLEHDGVLDMIELRRSTNMLDSNAVEKYSKHVKAIFQVGETKTDDWNTVLGYPIEFVPMSNPYNLKSGDQLQVKLLRDNEPLTNQLVYVGSTTHSHSHDGQGSHDHDESEEGHHHDALQLETNNKGIVTMTVDHDGHWYLRTIHMELKDEEGLTHESNWATLTFEVGHYHGFRLPKYLYWIFGALVLVGVIWMMTRK